MRKHIALLCLVLLCLPFYAFARGGDGGGVIVGNGAGVVEGNFQHAFQSLETVLPACLQNEYCQLTDSEKDTLATIYVLATVNNDNRDRFIFLSEKQNPGFFTTGETEGNRIAKTFPRVGSPIYVNTDLLYNDGQPALNFAAISSLIIHELGHQAGVEDHQYLDVIGAKVAAFMVMKTNHYAYTPENEKPIVFSITNHGPGLKRPLLMFNFKNQKSVNLTQILWQSSSCKSEQEVRTSIELTNGHFLFDEVNHLKFKAWISVKCTDHKTKSSKVVKRFLTIGLDDEYDIEDFAVN